MVYPELEDGFVVAARLLEVGRDEVEPLIHVDRLELALALPATRVNGGQIFKTPAAVAACLWRNCSLNRILPRQNVRFGFAMSMLYLELDGHAWRWQPGDAERLAHFAEKLRAGEDPGGALVTWMNERIITSKRSKPKRLAGAIAHMLHLTGPTSGLADDEWPIIQRWAVTVDDAVLEFLNGSSEAVEIYTQRPRSSDQLNYDELSSSLDERFHQADAMIVLAYKSSEGVGIKCEKAARRLMPMLYLHPSRRKPGRRMRKALAEAGASVHPFEHDEDDPSVAEKWIRHLTLAWLQSEAPRIANAARRRRDHESRVARMLALLRRAATQIHPRQLKINLASVGLTEDRASALMGSEWEYLSASVHEQLAISAALSVAANVDGIVPERPIDRPAYLLPEEFEALRRLARVDRIPPIEVLEMVALAQQELATLGRKRINFNTEIAWRDVRRRLKS